MSLRPRLLDTAASNLGRTMPPRLSIDANRFTLIDSTGNEKPIQQLSLDVVFIDLNPKTSKLYFGKEYNPNDTGDLPKCWSDNGVAPSAQADQPQAPQCMTCQHNVIGSAVSKFSGTKIKACVDMKKLAFVIPEDPSRLIYLMTIKPGSFKNWSSYVNWLKVQKMGDQQPDLPDVITRLSFESQGVLKFEPAALANAPALLAQVEEAYGRGVTDDMVGKNDMPWSGQLAAPQPAQQLPPPVQPAAPPPMSRELPSGIQFLPQNPSETAPPRAKRRTKAEMEAAKAGQPAPAAQPAPFQGFTNPQPAPTSAPLVPPVQQQMFPPTAQAADPQTDIPPFLRRNTEPAAPPPQPSFGMATPAPASADLQAAIDKAFSLPT